MEEVSVIGLPMMYAGDIDDVSTRERARRRLAFGASATYQIYGQAWRRHIEDDRQSLEFLRG